MKIPSFIVRCSLFAVLCFSAPAAFAAELPTATAVAPPAPALPPTALLITVLVPLLIAVAKKLFPQIPSAALPVFAPVLGAVLELGLSRLGLDGGGTLTGAVAGGAGVGVREMYDQGCKAVPRAAGTAALCFLCGLLFFTPGCAGFSNHQSDRSLTTLPDGTREERVITSQQRANTLFDSKSALAKLRATQTDKTQGLSIGALEQESVTPQVAQAVGLDLIVQFLSTPQGQALLKTFMRLQGVPVP
jgi:hypothetical protein